jgi:hypothetical protein
MRAAVARTRNKGYYRVLHVPIWIWVFFTLPGGLTEALYAHGFGREQAVWLALVTAVCVWRGAKGRLPGAEARPYITHYGLDWPNLGYRVVCYTAAWIAILAPWTLNLIGLTAAVTTGRWIVAALYGWPYDVVAGLIVLAAARNQLPRARRTIYDEGTDRAWFYVGVWTAVIAQLAGWAMWRLGAHLGLAAAPLAWARLGAFVAVSAAVLGLGLAAKLPRTRRYGVEAGAELQPAGPE